MQSADTTPSADAPVKQALKTILTAFLSALSGAALSTAIVGGILMNRVSVLEQSDKDQMIEIKRLDRDGSQKMQQYAIELAGFKLQYAEFSARQIVQIEKLARIETVLARLDRNTP
jgi:hypothetical protein